MSESNQVHSTWWGQLSLGDGQTAHWEIGPLRLVVQRLPNECQIAYEWDEAASLDTETWERTISAPDISQLGYANVERYVLRQPDTTLGVMPDLADRPIITRPFTPLHILAEEEATIFVSSPLWVSVEVGEPPTKLQEVPIMRPSDTWFGPSTMEGELCYASRTYARLSLDNIPARSHRAITKITVYNKADSQLLIERLSLPVPYLSLFQSADGLLWTQAVTLMRTRATGMAVFQIEQEPPAEAKDAKLIRDPRQPAERSMIIRAFGTLFG